jgi:phosphoglycerol transferase MdoB-like AlkP superfamily enzyme
MIGVSLWQLRRRRGLLEWATFLGWLVLAFRLASGTGISVVGLLDDLAVASGGMVLYALLEHAAPRLRAAALFAAGVVLAVCYASSALFYRFYQTYLRVGTLAMIGSTAQGVVSIEALLTPEFLLGCVVVPMLLLFAATRQAAGRRGHASHGLAIGSALACAAGLSFGGGGESFAASRNDPVTYLLRDAWRDLSAVRGRDPALIPLAMRMSRDETYNLAFEPGLYASGAVEYPLLRLPALDDRSSGAKRWNVVLILMESVRGYETGLVPEASVAPHLSRLSEQGLFFTNVYFNATQTAPAEASVLCSVLPDSTGGPIYLRYPSLSLRCLPEILAERGYETHWISSFHASFTNKREFLTAHGIRFIHDQEELERHGLARPQISWAAADDDLMDFSTAILDRAQQPFFAEIMTVSNHFPWELGSFGIPVPESVREAPGSSDYRGYLMGMHYTDHAVGRFLEGARAHPWFDRTLFVVVGDHGVWMFPDSLAGRSIGPLEKNEIYSRAGLLIWAPALIPSRRVDALGSQIDLAPTLLDLLGVREANGFEGISLLADVPASRRFAVMVSESSWNIRQGDRYCYDLGQSCFAETQPRCAPGEAPQPAARACFRYGGDLLRPDSARAEPAEMPAGERADLLARGTRLVRFNDELIRTDSFFPRSLRAGVSAGRGND